MAANGCQGGQNGAAPPPQTAPDGSVAAKGSHKPLTSCCGVPVMDSSLRGAQEDLCDVCGWEVCSECAGKWEADETTTARCKRCVREMEILRGMSSEEAEMNADKIEALLQEEFGR